MGAKFFPSQRNWLIQRLGGRREPKYIPVVADPPPVSGWSSFQPGTDSYDDYLDTYIQEGANETTNYETAATVIVDANASDERYGLWRWSGVNGAGLSGHFNDNTTTRVTSASIDFEVTSQGEGMVLNELLTDYDFTSITWSNSTPVSGTDMTLSAVGIWPGDDGYTGPINIVLDATTVERWIRHPESNLGLWGYAAGTDPLNGQQVSSDDEPTIADRPRLTIAWEEPASAAP